MRRLSHWNTAASALFSAWLLLVSFGTEGRASDNLLGSVPVGTEDADFFERRIRPLLMKECLQCHGEEKQEGGLRLDSRLSIIEGGSSGPAVDLVQVAESLLLKVVSGRHLEITMPPKKRLRPEERSYLRRWIEMGVPWSETKGTEEGLVGEADARDFWSFKAPERHARPTVSLKNWPVQPIDFFVVAEMEKRNMEPAPRATPAQWIRRLAFDLTGLPPDQDLLEKIQESDDLLTRIEVVNQLINSPRYGERLASLWLTLVRYAEDQGHLVDNDESPFYPNAFHYRQWVIDAFNRDLSYDDFIRYQLAADKMEPADGPNQAALGYMGLGHKYYLRKELAVQADEWEERVDTVSRSLLGLTVACARCHDHKYDPISTRDYYALAGVFASTRLFNRPEMTLIRNPKNNLVIEVIPEPETLHLIEDHEVRDLPVYIRGDIERPGAIVPRGFLSILSSKPEGRREFKEGSGRLELANAIVQRDNPLAARVLVNRIWGLFFGRPMVSTPSNFGTLGTKPSHPALLDDLAVRFMDNGWSVKTLVRELVLSATYAQASVNPQVPPADDPENRWLSRMPRRRLTVEMWRDAVLTATEELVHEGGRSGEVDDPDFLRRAVFGKVSRLKLNPFLAQFDYPDANVHSAKRLVTTTPLQKLFMLNSPWINRRASTFADQRLQETSEDLERQISETYQRLFGRLPSNRELALGLVFFEGNQAREEQWQKYAQVLLTCNEMLYLD